MLRANGANHFVFEQNLIAIRPVLKMLTQFTQIIWLYQYPTIDFYGNNNNANTDVVSQKMHNYNQIVRRALA